MIRGIAVLFAQQRMTDQLLYWDRKDVKLVRKMVISSVYFNRERVSIKYNIRIHHECEGRIENSVPRMTIWHQEACRVMINGDPEGRTFFYPTLTRKLDSFHYHILFLRKGSQKFLNTPRCDML